MTVGEVLNDGDEQAAMGLAAELADKAARSPLSADFVRGQIEAWEKEMTA